jgi:alkylation response protein AidB-like acyl-CoA dehydrogenase
LSGEKEICLAITEPSAGSDVRQITTTAEKTPDGKHYIVNGEKKMSTTNECGRRGADFLVLDYQRDIL